MKKIISILLTAAMVFGMTVALADTTYENSAFIGSWVARGADGQINARLYVDFCDSERIKCRFETYKGGETERLYEVYQAPISDTKAKSTFSTTKSVNNWFPSGTAEIELTADRINFAIAASNGVNLYNGIFSPESTEFNSQVSPYNTNVHIKVNESSILPEQAPFILKHRTYVPLRGIFEALNINVEWFDTQVGGVHTHEIRATRGDYIISIKRENKNGKGFGSWTLTKQVLGEVKEVDLWEVQPVIINDYTFVPLRVIVESFDTFIDWDDATRTVLITDENAVTKEEDISADLVPPAEGTEDEIEVPQTPAEDDAEAVTEEENTGDTAMEEADENASEEEGAEDGEATPTEDESVQESTEDNAEDSNVTEGTME